MCHQNHLPRFSNGGNHQIVRANWLTYTCQMTTYYCIFNRSKIIVDHTYIFRLEA